MPMNNSNKAIAARINKELRIRNWSQTILLKKIIKFKNPEITKSDLCVEVNKRKGNFSTTLKGKEERSIPKEDLYIISKIFGVSLEYIWFGDKKKENFIPKGARYAAFQDSESEYRTYIADLDYEDKVQYADECGFNLFDYFGQFDSINGYKFFLKNYNLHFNYFQFGELIYVDSEGHSQLCHSRDNDYLISDNLIMILTEHNDLKTFKAIYFDNCSLERFDSDHAYNRNKTLFSDYFLETLLKNEPFFELIMKDREVDVGSFSRYYEKGTKRLFVEPMFYEALSFALQHEEDYKSQLLKMLGFALEFSKKQYELIKNYIKTHYDKDEHADVHVDQYATRFLRSSRNIPMGNVFKIREKVEDESLKSLINEIEQCTFNMTHIINAQEKKNEEIIISTPNNSLFLELCNNAREQKASFVPLMLHSDKEFTYFQNYESTAINFDNLDQLQLVIDYLNKAQNLVESKSNKVLVHGDLANKVLMVENGKVVGLAGWQNCHYGNKYEDRAVLLSNIDTYSYHSDYLKKYKESFDVLSHDLDQIEKVKLVDRAIDILTDRRKSIAKEDKSNLLRICYLKEKTSRLELFKELYLIK